jgi:hypothetical protein
MSAGVYLRWRWMAAICVVVVALAAMMMVQAFEFLRQVEALDQCLQQRQVCAEALYALTAGPEAGVVPRAVAEDVPSAGTEDASLSEGDAPPSLQDQVQEIVAPHDGQRR